MAVGGRRRALATAVSVLLAAVLAVAMAGRACGAEDDSPVGAVRAFVAAARTGDRDALYELLGPRTRAALDARAARAGQLVGGERRFSPREMIAVSAAADLPPPRDYELVEARDGRAVVAIVDADGERHRVDLVEVDGRWRLELL